MPDERLLEELARLRVETLSRKYGVQASSEHVARARQRLQSSLESARRVDVLRDDHRLRAAVVEVAPKKGTFGIERHQWLVELDIRDEDAVRFTGEALARAEFDPHAALTLDAAHLALLADLQSRGMRISTLTYLGVPGECLRRHRCRFRQDDLQRHELEIRDLAATDIADIARVRREHFGAQPYGLVEDAPSADVQARLDATTREKLTKQLQNDPPTHWVVTRGGSIVGDFGFGVRELPVLGRCAGVEIVLTAPIQGIGLGAFAYKLMLERMIEVDTPCFVGTTSNPAVVHLAATMGRWVDALELKYEPDTPISDLASAARDSR